MTIRVIKRVWRREIILHKTALKATDVMYRGNMINILEDAPPVTAGSAYNLFQCDLII